MKLKKWLYEVHQMSYAEYKLLADTEQWNLQAEFNQFNKNMIQREMFIQSGGIIRTMSDDEFDDFILRGKKEQIRYETSLKIGGIDERGNYTALHHR